MHTVLHPVRRTLPAGVAIGRGPAVLVVLAWVIGVAPVAADPPAAHQVLTVTASAGLSLTSGNTDTSTVNAAYAMTYDPQTKNVVKSDGLIIHGVTDGVLSADRVGLNGREEHKIVDGAFVFAQNQYLHDRFKSIDYLVAPTAGFGYRPFDTAQTKLGMDGGVGAVWEKNPGFDVKTSGALTVGDNFAQTLTPTAVFAQTFSGLWKTNDFGNALYLTSVGVAVTMSARTQLKAELLDTFKNKPPLPTVRKNDLAVLMAIVYKM